MTKGYYNVIHNPEKTEIIFEINVEEGVEIPDEQQNLVMDIANSLSIIDLLYTSNTISFNKAFQQLFYISKTGLEGNKAQPSLAIKALIQFKKEIVDRESGRIKNQYLKKLGIRAFILSIPILILSLVMFLLPLHFHQLNFPEWKVSANMMILWSGTMIGVWLSFAISRTLIGFDDLAIIEKDRLEPTLRLLFTGILSLIFGFLFMLNAFEIKLGGLSSQNIVSDPTTAFLIGTILGLNEKIVGNTLTKKTSELLHS